MAVFDLYSRRKRQAKGEVPDVFVYDDLPDQLRVQIVQICSDAIDREGWDLVHRIVAREWGVFELSAGASAAERCSKAILERGTDDVLDVVEASFSYIDTIAREHSSNEQRRRGIAMSASSAITELNDRFRLAGVGYTFENGRILRVDSEFIHSEVVVPALRYLNVRGFEGPRDEFLNAHAHYRAGEVKDAIVDANNAFESALKAICDLNGWDYATGARASDLINVVRQRGLLPDYLDRSFDQLAATLKSGLPRVRGEEGAHGQGAVPRETPGYVAAYALHLAAAKILFLVEAHECRGT